MGEREKERERREREEREKGKRREREGKEERGEGKEKGKRREREGKEKRGRREREKNEREKRVLPFFFLFSVLNPKALLRKCKARTRANVMFSPSGRGKKGAWKRVYITTRAPSRIFVHFRLYKDKLNPTRFVECII